MQPVWTSNDILPLVCTHITTVQNLATLSQTNKLLNNYLFSTTGGKHWIQAGKLMCGDEYWPANPLEKTNPRYLTMIYMCPWISEPHKIFLSPKERNSLQSRRPITHDELINLDRLHGWAPENLSNYETITRAIKLHDGVLMVLQQERGNSEELEGNIYFTASKDLRLLRDMFYFSCESMYAKWIVEPGRIVCQNNYKQHAWQFGFRDDMKTHFLPREDSASTVMAFWAAYRGDMRTALDGLKGLHLSDINCHYVDLCQHTIASGSIDALRMLIEADISTADHYSFVHALEIGREDMARLMLSATVHDVSAEDIISKYRCIGWERINGWMDHGCSHGMPKDLKHMLDLYKKSKITVDGKTIADIIDELMNEARVKMNRVMRAVRPTVWK